MFDRIGQSFEEYIPHPYMYIYPFHFTFLNKNINTYEDQIVVSNQAANHQLSWEAVWNTSVS